MYIYIYIYVYVHTYLYIYICIRWASAWRARREANTVKEERERGVGRKESVCVVWSVFPP